METKPTLPETKTLFVTVLGAPNAGKSTLINQLAQAKVSIVSPKVQTTRFRVRGIRCIEQTQLVMIDTPGVFEPKQRFDNAMVKAAWDGAVEADMVLLVVDARKGEDANTASIIDRLKDSGKPCVLVLNKVDTVQPKQKLLAMSQHFMKRYDFLTIFMLSALEGDGIEDLEKFLVEKARPSPWFYGADQLTDIQERLFAAEITREHLFHGMHQELPYSLTVETEGWEEKKSGIKINQVIIVERETHKKMIIGNKGENLKRIGEASRHELTSLLGQKVHLFLHVKVREGWKDKAEFYNTLGLEFDS